MNRSEFIKVFAERANLTQKDAREVTKAMFEVITENMKSEGGVSPAEGYRFYTVHKEAREARNPQTGEMIPVPEKDVPKVKFSQSFKAAIA